MEALDIEGVFWLAQNPDDQVAGRLTFDAQNGIELDLIGAFNDINNVMTLRADQGISITDKEFFNRRADSIRIYGSTTKGPVTIDDCSPVGSSFTIGGQRQIPRQTYDGRVVLLGAQLDHEDTLPGFTGIKASIRNLEHWVSKSGVSIMFTQDHDSGSPRLDRIDIDLPESLVSTTGSEELKFSFRGVLRGDHIVETVVEQNCQFSMCTTEPRAYEALLKACTSLQDLITIGLDEPSVITSVSVRLSRSKPSAETGQCTSEWVRLYAKLLGSDIEPERNRSMLSTRYSHSMILGAWTVCVGG